jgi:hypothetical protein
MDHTQTHLSVSSSFSFVRATRGLVITLILGNNSDEAFVWMEFLLMTLGLRDIDLKVYRGAKTQCYRATVCRNAYWSTRIQYPFWDSIWEETRVGLKFKMSLSQP